jgi:hypothetical protein
MIDKSNLINSFIASQILGDGSVTKHQSISIYHEQQWSDYLIWKVNLAKELGLMPGTIRQWSAQSNIKFQHRIGVDINVPLVYLQYQDPVELIYRLDPLGLLLWWLDDGCLSVHEKRNGVSVSRFGYLCTENFDSFINQRMSAALVTHFGIYTNIHMDRGGILSKDMVYYRLYLNATNMRLLIDIVRPYIEYVPSCMLYKLNMDYRPNRISTSLEYSQKYNF